MIELSNLQAIREVVTIVGVIAGLSYYILVVRSNNKARQIQIISQISDFTSEEWQKKGIQLLELEWSDYDDFERKYGSDVNPDNFGMRYEAWTRFNQLGFMLHNKTLDIESLRSIFGGAAGPLWQWHKFESIILEQRRRYNLPELFMWWEYLANEVRKYRVSKGYGDKIPENYASYVPDE